MKLCIKCQTVKPFTEFYKASKAAGGEYRSYCKPCNNAVAKAWNERNRERARKTKRVQMKRWREANPERWKEICNKAGKKFKAANPDKVRTARERAIERRRKLYPEKYAAKQAVLIAKRQGILLRQSCEVCGEPNTHAHHDDYSKPLSVRWLCPRHHSEHHANERRKHSR